ncbi:MAG: tetratricopeptide repeat protein [Propionibacteriaceae bacterium]|nr:tetratricopeptide repeat protein [Propionibacteriaceae bacterium]
MAILFGVFQDEFDAGRYHDALDTALGLADMGYTRGHYLSSLVYDELGHERDADRAAHHAASAGDPDGLRRWGLAFRRRERLRPAVRALARAARIKPDPEWDALLVDWRYWAGDPAATVEALSEAGKAEPFVRLTTAYALEAAGRVEEARQLFESAARDGYSEAWVPLGNMADERGDPDLALELFARSVEATGDRHALFNAAVIRWNRGERKEATNLFREAADTDRWARRRLSRAHRTRKRAKFDAQTHAKR